MSNLSDENFEVLLRNIFTSGFNLDFNTQIINGSVHSIGVLSSTGRNVNIYFFLFDGEWMKRRNNSVFKVNINDVIDFCIKVKNTHGQKVYVGIHYNMVDTVIKIIKPILDTLSSLGVDTIYAFYLNDPEPSCIVKDNDKWLYHGYDDTWYLNMNITSLTAIDVHIPITDTLCGG